MKLRRLNDSGVRAFQALLADCREGLQVFPQKLIDDEKLSEQFPVDIDFELIDFATRLEAGKYFTELFERYRHLSGSIENDAKLWAWLGLTWFDYLAPETGSDGARKPGQDSRWILQPGNYQTYYRHLLAGPTSIYRAHRDSPDRALAVLGGSVRAPGDIVEQLASRQDFVASCSLMQVATDLYFDRERLTLKVGAASQSGGGARRLVSVVQQFMRTWDLNERSAVDIMAMLPAEFDRFK